MGRQSYGKAEDCPKHSIALFRVRFVDGDYDDGGAYWGGALNVVRSIVLASETPIAPSLAQKVVSKLQAAFIFPKISSK